MLSREEGKNKMKNRLAALLVGLLVFPLTGMLSGADAPPFAVSIHPQQESVVQGRDVILEITLKKDRKSVV